MHLPVHLAATTGTAADDEVGTVWLVPETAVGRFHVSRESSDFDVLHDICSYRDTSKFGRRSETAKGNRRTIAKLCCVLGLWRSAN